jgi:hypothetical protein
MKKRADSALPPAAEAAVQHYTLECSAELQRFDSDFQEQFADADWMTGFALLIKYARERFDLVAEQCLFTSTSSDPSTINPAYEKYLGQLEKKTLANVNFVLKSVRSDVREDLASRIATKLSGRKLFWLSEAKRRHLDRHATPASTRSDLAPPLPAQPEVTNVAGLKRLRSTVLSPVAARRMEHYMESHGGQTDFANKVGTTDRTLRSFRKNGRIRRDIFEAIAGAMGTTPEELLKSE